MIKLLTSIVTFITSIVTFIVHTIGSLLNFITLIPQYAAFLVTSLNVLPSVIVPFAIASVSIYVVLFIINRK